VKHTSSPTLHIFTFSRFWIWVFLLLLSAVLFYGLISLPPAGETNPTFHVASRYLDRGTDETGMACSFLAVLLDYRSFDLALLSLFFLSVTLTVLLFLTAENISLTRLKWGWVWLSLFSSLALLVLGCFSFKNGGNFMDYQFWAVVFGPSARTNGAWITGLLVFLNVASSLMWTRIVLARGKEKRFDTE
jgi:hypothetical protein